MHLSRSKTLRFSLVMAFLFSLVPTIGNLAGAASSMVGATVAVESETYEPGETVAVSIDLQNNDIRRMRADVRLSIVDPNGDLVHERAWWKVRASSTIQLNDQFPAGAVPGTYLVGLEVSTKAGKSTEIYVMDDAIAMFRVTSDQQSVPSPEPTEEATATPEPTAMPEPTAQPTSEPEPTAAPEQPRVLFGVYPGGGNGELGYVEPPAASTVMAKLNELRGDQAFDIHLYTAWSWYDQESLRHEIEQYTAAGMYVTLSIKYSPPSGSEGDVDGFVAFVEQVIESHATNPLVHRIVIGNEINVVNGNPSSSDGPFANVNEATIAGVLAGRSKLNAIGQSATQIGISLAVLERETDAQFLQELADLGGDAFRSTVDFMGLNVYPGLWPAGTGDAYNDMVTHLRNGRYSLSTAGFDSDVKLAILENGFPTSDADLQLTKLDGFLRAVCDTKDEAGLASYSWFDLWDADSNADSRYAHYGLLRSDMTPKPGFDQYRNVIAEGCNR